MVKIDIDKIKEYLATQPVVKAWLFGSFARGEANDQSDIDLLVTFDKDSHVGLLKHADMIFGLESILHRSVDLVTEGSLLPWVRKEVETDRILIYERGT